jgi:hypothetical protein
MERPNHFKDRIPSKNKKSHPQTQKPKINTALPKKKPSSPDTKSPQQ